MASKITGNVGKPKINFDADADIWLVPIKSLTTPGIEQTEIGGRSLTEYINRKVSEASLAKKRRIEGEANGGGELEDGVLDDASGEGNGGNSVVGGKDDGIGIAGVWGENNGVGAVGRTTDGNSKKKIVKKTAKKQKNQKQQEARKRA